jgi:hypothetical protein
MRYFERNINYFSEENIINENDVFTGWISDEKNLMKLWVLILRKKMNIYTEFTFIFGIFL